MKRDKMKKLLVCALVVLAVSMMAACSKPTGSKNYKGYEEYLHLHEETITLSDYDEISSIELDVNTDSKQVEYRLTNGDGTLFYHWTGEIENITSLDEWERITVNAKIDLFYGNELGEDNAKNVEVFILRSADIAYINHPDMGELDIIIKMSETGEPAKDPHDMKEIHELLYGN